MDGGEAHVQLFLLLLVVLEAVIIPSLISRREGGSDLVPVVRVGTQRPHPV